MRRFWKPPKSDAQLVSAVSVLTHALIEEYRFGRGMSAEQAEYTVHVLIDLPGLPEKLRAVA